MAKKYGLLLLLLVFVGPKLFSQSDTLKGLTDETMLHPGDAFTGYVFKKGELAYNQALTPYPSWAWWGVTDWLTAEIDIEAWLGGVPSFNFRFGIIRNNGWVPAVAFETMYQYIDRQLDQFDNLDYLTVNRKGSSCYAHINLSWQLRANFFLHVSGGAAYAEYIEFNNNDLIHKVYAGFENRFHSDYSIALDWRVKRWFSPHSSYSYGSTFLYADNIPRKKQFVLATRMAPFVGKRSGFLNKLRFELAFLYSEFPDADQLIAGPIGFFYWQW